MVWRLTNDPTLFPDPHYGEDDGLIAVGGDLSPERLANAYCNGIFPWYGFKEHNEILWYCPLDRFVIFPSEIHISHSMRQLINKGTYSVSINRDFDQVIENCSRADGRYDQEGAWLGDDMIKAYREMHRLHLAASVEVWDNDGRLVGGLYGINIGSNFFGESMFSLVPSASKLALIHLAHVLEPLGGIIDCQFETPHLKSMGGRHISYEEYMEVISEK
ncbi:MAG: leucyl/phenylalanyl-tRNA--protein transferase [Prevotellaceae bacterium]|nr:leucyl/phenylalanyl-tRNA--protein transferase [Candidatus Colivivens caballi]